MTPRSRNMWPLIIECNKQVCLTVSYVSYISFIKLLISLRQFKQEMHSVFKREGLGWLILKESGKMK
jgi:hypothetical protein